MIADVVTIFIPAALIGLGLVVIEGEAKLRGARQLVAPGTSRFGTTNEGPELELPTYEPGPCDSKFSAGDETDVAQVLRWQDELTPERRARIWQPVADELAQRRGAR